MPTTSTPFALDEGPKVTSGGRGDWIVDSTLKSKFDQEFYSLSLQDGFASGGQLKNVMLNQDLKSNDVLAKIWDLADIDRDGKMDADEFALMMYMINYVKEGNALPENLPVRWVPPAKRAQWKKGNAPGAQ